MRDGFRTPIAKAVSILLVIGALLAPTAASAQPGADAAARRAPVQIRVATFNIRSVADTRRHGTYRPWLKRRGVVIRQIHRQHPTVIGLQEANPSPYFRNKVYRARNQYRDVLNALNRRGGHYAVTSRFGYNCANPDSKTKCRYRKRGASGSNRILYDTRRLTMTAHGNLTFRRQGSNYTTLAWARFRIRGNGHRFYFATTHLDPGSVAIRRAQVKQLKRSIARHGRGIRKIVAGDFNIHKYSPEAPALFGGFRRAGYGDALNTRYEVNPPVHRRARTTHNAWINSQNLGKVNVKAFSYWENRRKTGNSVDHVFLSNRLPVLDYTLVSRYSRSGRLLGIAPSDHALIRVTTRI